jgi:hypothetical protein
VLFFFFECLSCVRVNFLVMNELYHTEIIKYDHVISWIILIGY